MPTFDYRCPNCERVVEDSAPDAEVFCDCKLDPAPRMLRVYGISGVSFKGTGFYKNDKKR